MYLKVRRKRSINITIDGTFIGVRGKKYEGATKMYSGNKKDRGKRGYTIVTYFDSTNKMPISFETTNIHEIHAFETLIQRVIEMEKKEKRGCKEIELWGNKVTLYWKESKDKKKKNTYVKPACFYI